MKKPLEPTPEEQTRVATYWRWVEEAVRQQGHGVTPKPVQASQAELDKVARWKQWRDLMDCQHTSGITFSSAEAEMTCSDCGDVMHFMSETQIEEMRSEH